MTLKEIISRLKFTGLYKTTMDQMQALQRSLHSEWRAQSSSKTERARHITKVTLAKTFH
jgi:hypothetical protein